MRRAWRAALAAALALALLPVGPARAADPARVTVTLSVQGGTAALHGLDLELALPAGAAVEHEARSGRIKPGAVALLGKASSAVLEGKFVPSRKAPSVRVLVASLAPLPRGPILAVTLTVPGGVPAPSDFELARGLVAGEDGRPAPGAMLVVAEVRPAP